MSTMGMHLPNRRLLTGELETIMELFAKEILLYVSNPHDPNELAYWRGITSRMAVRSDMPRNAHVRIERRGRFTAAEDAVFLSMIINGWSPYIASWRMRNEPNLESREELSTTWGIYLRDFIARLRPLIPAGTVVNIPAVSPAPGWQSWVRAAIPYVGAGKFNGLDCHVYGDTTEVENLLAEYRLAYGGPLLCTETNYGPGVGRDDKLVVYPAQLPHIAYQFERRAVKPIYFIWEWMNPDSAWHVAANAKDNAIGAEIKRLNTEQVEPMPDGGSGVEFPFTTELELSPNYNRNADGTPVVDTTRSLVVIHSTRSGRVLTTDRKPWTLEHEWQSTIAYMLTPGTVSSDSVISPTRVGFTQNYGGSKILWHAAYNNQRSRGHEIAQPKPDTPYDIRQIKRAALIVRNDCLRDHIPMVRIMNENLSGIIGHEDSAQGIAGGKSDPGPRFPWAQFIDYVNDPNLWDPDPTDPEFNILGFQLYRNLHPDIGVPRSDAMLVGDGSGDMICRFKPNTTYPRGAVAYYRHWIFTETGDIVSAIDVMDWQ